MRYALLAPCLAAACLTAVEAPADHPPQVILPGTKADAGVTASRAAALWSIGDPTATEQHFLEQINRARAQPAAEGLLLKNTTDPDVTGAYTFFGVDLDLMASEFAALSVRPPLAFHGQLLTAARNHAQYLFDNALQSHTGSGGTNAGNRITAAGYTWSGYGENVYSYADSVWHGHAGFEVDWGNNPPSGMQAGRGHRANIHSGTFREVGIGVIAGTKTVGMNTVGPLVVVQDFATRSGITPLITGVVYEDGNANNAYDPGEGVGGVTIRVYTVPGGTEVAYYAVSASAGGYAVPVPGNGSYSAVFTASDGVTVLSTQAITVSGGANAKADVADASSGGGGGGGGSGGGGAGGGGGGGAPTASGGDGGGGCGSGSGSGLTALGLLLACFAWRRRRT